MSGREKQEELAEILEKTYLTNVIDTMREVSDRLVFLNGNVFHLEKTDYTTTLKWILMAI